MCSEEQVEGGGGEGKIFVHLDEVGEESWGYGVGGEEGCKEGTGGGEAARVGEDVEELGVSEEGGAARSEAEKVEGGVGVEAHAAEGGVEERVREGG